MGPITANDIKGYAAGFKLGYLVSRFKQDMDTFFSPPRKKAPTEFVYKDEYDKSVKKLRRTFWCN